jgi:hypothetical protein
MQPGADDVPGEDTIVRAAVALPHLELDERLDTRVRS